MERGGIEFSPSPSNTIESLSWRFEFPEYSYTRRFLDDMADISRRMEFYPNVSFGKTYVNVTIDAQSQIELGPQLKIFVSEMQKVAVSSMAKGADQPENR